MVDDGQYYGKAKEYFVVKVFEGCLEKLGFIPVHGTQKDLPVRD